MLIQGDVLEQTKLLKENTLDGILTDPPYALQFMGKDWDKCLPSVDVWKELLRVCKPGAYLLSFGGTRTYHRLTTNIEDGGWQIKDCLMWLHGQGFPKSLDIGKAIDKTLGAEREVIDTIGKCGMKTAASKYQDNEKWSGKVLGNPATSQAAQWDGYGTALKPAWEPIVLAQKPIDRTYAHNVLTHGCGGLNINGCRIATAEDLGRLNNSAATWGTYGNGASSQYGKPVAEQGRFPANLLLDEQSAEMLGSPARFFYCAKASRKEREQGLEDFPSKFLATMGDGIGEREHNPEQPTAWVKNNHPTVKPLALCEYLARLILPPTQDSKILVPFAGSGSEMIGAIKAGWSVVVGIEKEADYIAIANKRLSYAKHNL